MDASAWVVPGAVALVGGVIGLLMTQRLGGDADSGVAKQSARDDHETEKAEVLAALRALEAEKEKLEPAVWEREREALLARGAAAMAALEALEAPPPSLSEALVALMRSEQSRLGEASFRSLVLAQLGGAPQPPAKPANDALAPEWRGALYALGAVAVAVLLFVVIGGDTGQRIGDGPMTGRGGGAAAQPPPQAQADQQMLAQKAALRARLDADPNDLEALNGLTEIAFGEMDLASAMQLNQRALTVSADDPDARANKAMLSARVGMMERAFEELDAVLATAPDHEKALLYKGLLALRTGRPDLAVPALERLTAGPRGQDPFLQQQLAEARAALAQATGAPAAPPAGSAAPEVIVSGTLSLGEGVDTGGAQLLYVSLRDPAGGPPLAARKIPVTSWPIAFEIRASDQIAMGGSPRPLPAAFVVSARLDADGDPMTREPGAPEARIEGVSAGQAELAITLR